MVVIFLMLLILLGLFIFFVLVVPFMLSMIMLTGILFFLHNHVFSLDHSYWRRGGG